MPPAQPNHCHSCGVRYYRRQQIIAWQQLANGRWVETILRQCIDCQNGRRLLAAVQAKTVPTAKVRHIREERHLRAVAG